MGPLLSVREVSKRFGGIQALDSVSLMAAMLKLDEKTNPFVVLPGITVKTGSNDRRPLEQARLQRWQQDHWVPVGRVLAAK